MAPSQNQLVILKAICQFQDVARYHGVMPSKHAIAYPDDDVAALVDQGLVEWAHFTYGCGKEIKGLRLTSLGQRLLEKGVEPSPDQAKCEELAYEYLLILQDVYHFSHMPRYRRMLPEKKASYYIPSDLEDLLNRGYILKMKLKTQGERTLKGYVISDKGRRVLSQAGMCD